jgi:hypothetical protein
MEEFGVVNIHVITKDSDEDGDFPFIVVGGEDIEKELWELMGREGIPWLACVTAEYGVERQLRTQLFGGGRRRGLVVRLPPGVRLRLRFHAHHLRLALRPEVENSDVRELLIALLNRREFQIPDTVRQRFKRAVSLEIRSVGFGELEWNGETISYEDVEFSAKELANWIQRCTDLHRRGELDERHARGLLEAKRRAWKRAVDNLKRALGTELAEHLMRNGEIEFRSRDGRTYRITKSGEVFVRDERSGAWRGVCVEVAGERILPVPEVVLSKYLVLRDRPEQVREGPRADAVERLHMLRHELEELWRRREEIESHIQRLEQIYERIHSRLREVR